jgi:hypothetical protein
VASVALASAIPLETDDGQAFPGREVLSARNEPGSDPEVVDRVPRYPDVRSLR